MSETPRERGADADGFYLHVRIGGLCLLLPDPQKQRLHLLMPATEKHGPYHLHHARFKWGTGNTAPGVDLEETLDLTRLGSGVPKLDSIPNEVVDLSWVTDRSIKRELLEKPNDRVRCHVQLAAGEVTAPPPGGEWKIQRMSDGAEKIQLMATDIRWTIWIPGTSLKLGDLITGVPELFPKLEDGKLTVHVQIASEPKHPNPKKPKKGDRADHFKHFYDLFDNLTNTPPIPTLERLPPEHVPLDPDEKPAFYGKVKCILATASISG